MSDDPRTADMASALAGNGLRKSSRPFIEIDGRKYHARYPDDNLRAEWEEILRKRAMTEACKNVGSMADILKMMTVMGMLKEFNFWGSISLSMMSTHEGGIAWACLVLGCKEDVIRKVRGDPYKGIAGDPIKNLELITLLSKVATEAHPDPQEGGPPEMVEPNPTSGASA